MLRVLGVADVPALEAFLAARTETTMILRSNLARAGIEYTGRTFEGVYVGSFEGDALSGVAAHYWNGNIILAGGTPERAGALARHAASVSGLPVAGILGPYAEVTHARAALDLDGASTTYAGREILFDLDLEALVLSEIPEAVTWRSVADDELEMVLEWRMQFRVEAMGSSDTPEQRSEQRALLAGLHAREAHFVALSGGELVSYSAFNATLPDVVQIGGVYTPPGRRGRGYARAAVGGSLRIARERGVRRAILFTGETNASAIRCYEALGFRRAGDYGIVVFA